MERATPQQMRAALEIVDNFRKYGIHFVPVPVLNDDDATALAALSYQRLSDLEKQCEDK